MNKNKPEILVLFHTKDYYYTRLLNKKLASLGINLINRETSYVSKSETDTAENILILLSPRLLESIDSLTTVYKTILENKKKIRLCTIMLDINSFDQSSFIERAKNNNSIGLTSKLPLDNNDTVDQYLKNENIKYISYYTEQYKKYLESLMDKSKEKDIITLKKIYSELPILKKRLSDNPLQDFNILQTKSFSPILDFFDI